VIEGLGHIRLEVQDVARAVAFYRDGLRFGSLETGDAADQGVHFQAGRLHVVLVPTPNGRTPAAQNHGVRVTLDVAGVDAYHDALVARGLVPTAPSAEDDARSFVVVDPDGYEWCFRQSLH
jgi:catechol 2,3-dioxygenase-like lactoylglutathione lyase family enzyme